MAYGDVLINEDIPLVCQIGTGEEILFPQAIVRNAAGAVQFGGPVDLPHVGDGLYQDFSKSLSVTGKIAVTYIVYTDALHTTESKYHQRTNDVFTLVDPNEALPPTETPGKVEILGELFQDTVLLGQLSSDNIEGEVTNTNLIGEIPPSDLSAEITNRSLYGELECDNA